MPRRTSSKILQAVHRVKCGQHPQEVCRELEIDVPMTLYAALKRYGVTYTKISHSERRATPAARERQQAKRRQRACESLRVSGLPLTEQNITEALNSMFGECA